MSDWTFLTDHAHVLVLLARDPRTRVPALAEQLGVGEDEVERILADLRAAGYVEERSGGGPTVRVIDRRRPLRHPIEAHHEVGRLLDAVQTPSELLTERLLRDR